MAERTKMSVTGRTAVKVTLVLLTGLAWCCQPGAAMATDSKPAAAYERKIERLVADLGADSYLVREQAQAELVKIGSPAIQALARALDSDDLEVVQRAEKALAEIRKHAAEQADRRIKRNLLWEVQLRSGLDGSPAVVGDTVFFSGTAGGLQAVDARIGKRLWEFGTKPGCSFLAAGGKVYAANREGQLHSLDAKTGKVDAKFRAEALAGAPALADGVIHALSTKGAVLALTPTRVGPSGGRKWGPSGAGCARSWGRRPSMSLPPMVS
jgi:hypothetical protein